MKQEDFQGLGGDAEVGTAFGAALGRGVRARRTRSRRPRSERPFLNPLKMDSGRNLQANVLKKAERRGGAPEGPPRVGSGGAAYSIYGLYRVRSPPPSVGPQTVPEGNVLGPDCGGEAVL